MIAEKQPTCIKCKEEKHLEFDIGWEEIIDNSDCVNNPEGSARIFWICPKCIRKMEIVKMKEAEIENLKDENISCAMQLAETTKPHCIKCGESMGHDGRGWMRLNESTGNGDVIDRNKLYLCGSCINKSEAVKDVKEFMLKNPQG